MTDAGYRAVHDSSETFPERFGIHVGGTSPEYVVAGLFVWEDGDFRNIRLGELREVLREVEAKGL
jgi:hypothetical protein